MRRILRRGVQGLGGFVLVVLAGIVVANCSITHRADDYMFATLAEVPARTYAIVPGASVWGKQPSHALVDRLETSRALFAAGRVQRIFVSGDGKADEDGVMARWLVAHGVPAERIVRDGTGYRTRTTMENARAIGIRDAIVCTQHFHEARSVIWARHLDIDAVGLTADHVAYTHHYHDDLREAGARTAAMVEMWID